MKQNTIRYRLFSWLVKKVFRVPLGQRLPWIAIATQFVLMPLSTGFYFWSSHNDIYDPIRRIVTVLGVDYSIQIFEFFAADANIGTYFKFENFENGTVTVTKINK